MVTLSKVAASWYNIRVWCIRFLIKQVLNGVSAFPTSCILRKVHSIKYIKYFFWQLRLCYILKDFLFRQLVNVGVFLTCLHDYISNHENNVASWLLPQWLCGNSSIWAWCTVIQLYIICPSPWVATEPLWW